MRPQIVFLFAAALAIAQPNASDRKISTAQPAWHVAFIDGGKTVVAACADGKLRFWDARSGALLREGPADTSAGPRTISFSSRDHLAALTRDGGVQVRNATVDSVLHQLPPITPRATSLAVSDDGSRIATGHMLDRQSSVNTIRVRDKSGKELLKTTAGIGGISVLGFSPDGSTLVAGSNDADMRVWHVGKGELVRLIDSLPVSMFALSFSPDGKWLATAGADRTIYLWDTATWAAVRKITGQPEMISSLRFSPDGKRLVSGGFSELSAASPVKLMVWDLATAKQLRVMDAPRRVASLAFSPDGRVVASTHGGQSIDLWHLPE